MMKKQLAILLLVTSLIGCESEDSPIYKYVPIQTGEEIDKGWFTYTYHDIQDNYKEIEELQEDLRDETLTWEVASQRSLRLAYIYELCLVNSNGYNYEALNFDEALFDMWNLPKYIKLEECY